MTDRELLELAAKAAGITVLGGHEMPNGYWLETDIGFWNPLKNHGPGLRLAILLKLAIEIERDFTVVTYSNCEIEFIEDHKGDPGTATLRAIVRAAAEIGKESK